MRRKFLVCGLALLAAFSIGLLGFFAVSDGRPDGLESVLGSQGVQEPSPIWSAPLDYGSDFLSALLMGIVGFGLVLVASIVFLKIASRRKHQGTK